MEELTELKFFIKKLGKDTYFYALAKLIPGIFNVASVAIFTRIFNPAEYGQYIIVITTSIVLTAIFSQWITQSVLRYRSQYVQNKKSAMFNKYIFLTLVLISLIICVLGIVFYPIKKFLSIYQSYYLISIILIISNLWFENLVAILQADLKSRFFSLSLITNGVLKFICPLFLVLFISRNVENLLWGTFLSFFIVTFILILNFYFQFKKSIPKDDFNNKDEDFFSFIRKFFIYGFPLIGWFLGAEILSVMDRYFLQIFCSSEEVGIYTSNYNLVVSAITFISMPLLTAAHPLLMKAGSLLSNKDDIQNLITEFSRYFLLIAFPVMSYLLILHKELAEIFLGIEYRQGSLVMIPVTVGLIGWYFAMFGHKGLELQEKTHIMFIYIIICTVVKIIMNLILIIKYGYMGAAITTLISFLLYPTLVYFGAKSNIRWNICWKSMLKLVIASTALAFVFYSIKILRIKSYITIIACGLLLPPLYLFILIILKEIKSYELSFVKNILKAKR